MTSLRLRVSAQLDDVSDDTRSVELVVVGEYASKCEKHIELDVTSDE